MSKTIKIGGRIESAEQGGIVTGANAIFDDTKGKKQNVINSETDDELARLDSAKQDVLTFDNAPTEGSNNPVKSGGVYAADAALQQAIEAILLLIPSAASALNQLADKAFVNSTVATNTSTFRGTYNVVTDLSLHYNSTHQEIATALLSVVQTADNNDYCFVQIPVSDSSGDIRVTERYKFNGTAWSYEYDLNNSGFTAAQWAAINSTITQALVEKLGALPTAAELAIALNGKQNTLTFDTTPIAGSSNPVTSAGLYAAFQAINATIPAGASVDNKLVAETRLAEYVAAIINALDATYNVTSTDGHVNVRLMQVDGVITSLEVLTSDIASAADVTALTTRVSTNEGDIAQLQDAYEALTQSKPVIVEPTDTWPVAAPQEGVIYRVIDRVNTPPQNYSDYMYNGTAMVLMGTYDNAIDDIPTPGSNNLVKSGGVASHIVYDISEANAVGSVLATYADLAAALGNNGANIPPSIQKGGMSVKFVQSSDNKYVQFRCIADEFTTDITQWAIAEEGVYVENPEFVYVKTDNEGKILWAIKSDGGIYYGAGCPQQVKDYIEEKISSLSLDEYEDIVTFLGSLIEGDTLATLLNAKVDKITGKSLIDSEFATSQEVVTNPEYLQVTTDSEGRIIKGITKRGTEQVMIEVEFPNGIPNDIKKYVNARTSETGFKIINPYGDLTGKVRHRAISHEHIDRQQKLEDAINDGIDILCASNYGPGVPVYGLEQDSENANKYNYSHDYLDWEFIRDQENHILYDTYADGVVKTIKDSQGNEFKIPLLRKVTKTFSGSFVNFTKRDETECDLSSLVMLPNTEHAHYSIDGLQGLWSPHLCLLGTNWGDAVNSNPDDNDFYSGRTAYNNDNSYNMSASEFHSKFPLWSLHQAIVQAQNNVIYKNKLFGTINHPGFTYLQDWHVDELVNNWPEIFKAMEIYNHSDSEYWANYNIQFYDRTLLRGVKLWCTAVNDWGKGVNTPASYPNRRGCNLLYLDASYENQTLAKKEEMVLDAYIAGHFSACGYGNIDISNIIIDAGSISITFNSIPDKTIIDIDGVRTEGGSVPTLYVELTSANKFVRFEAYKGEDFIFSQPFFVEK